MSWRCREFAEARQDAVESSCELIPGACCIGARARSDVGALCKRYVVVGLSWLRDHGRSARLMMPCVSQASLAYPTSPRR